MIKVIVFIKKRADISTEQFRHHYESVHAPMVDVLLPYYATYRRNYVDGSVRLGGPDFGYDVVTELEFASAAEYEAWQAALQDPEVLAKIRADEAHFVASSETRMYAVSPFESDYSGRE